MLSAVAWAATILAFAAAGQSIDVQLTIGQAALLASGVALASAIPAGPASLGTFELAAVEIGKAIGIELDRGVRARADRPRIDPRRHLGRSASPRWSGWAGPRRDGGDARALTGVTPGRRAGQSGGSPVEARSGPVDARAASACPNEWGDTGYGSKVSAPPASRRTV